MSIFDVSEVTLPEYDLMFVSRVYAVSTIMNRVFVRQFMTSSELTLQMHIGRGSQSYLVHSQSGFGEKHERICGKGTHDLGSQERPKYIGYLQVP